MRRSGGPKVVYSLSFWRQDLKKHRQSIIFEGVRPKRQTVHQFDTIPLPAKTLQGSPHEAIPSQK